MGIGIGIGIGIGVGIGIGIGIGEWGIESREWRLGIRDSGADSG